LSDAMRDGRKEILRVGDFEFSTFDFFYFAGVSLLFLLLIVFIEC
jgi:hypothetical protein